jgi:uncharacterized coiled-coil DUF342 family protein
MAKSKKQPLASFQKLLNRAGQIFSQDPSANSKDILMAGPKIPGEKKVAITPEVKELRNRRLYLKIRLPALRQEVKDLSEERKTLSEKLKNAEKLSPEEQTKLRQRRIYVIQHHSALRAEAATLTEERKTVFEKLKNVKSE